MAAAVATDLSVTTDGLVVCLSKCSNNHRVFGITLFNPSEQGYHLALDYVEATSETHLALVADPVDPSTLRSLDDVRNIIMWMFTVSGKFAAHTIDAIDRALKDGCGVRLEVRLGVVIEPLL